MCSVIFFPLCQYFFFYLFFFFFNVPATTEIYTLSLHDALPISRPCPSARCAHATPNSLVSAVSITAAATAAAAPWNRYSDLESSLRHLLSRSVATLLRTRLCTCSWGSPSREVCCRNDPITQSRACSHFPSSVRDSVPEPRW